jgi:peptide/nickel transport system permease protein
MTLFILRRFVQAVVSVLLISLALYSYFVYLSPYAVRKEYDSDIAIAVQEQEPEYNEFEMLDSYKDHARDFYKDSVTALQETFKMDKPWPYNFVLWVFDPQTTMQKNADGTLSPKGIDIDILGLHIKGSGMLTGDFGTSSVFYSPSLGAQLADKWTNSLLLMATSIFLALLIALPVGIISAINQNSRLDTVLTFATFIGLSIPPFMLAFVLSSLFGLLPYNLREQQGWDWMPMLLPGYVYTLDQEGNWINRIYHMILPVTTLALVQGALLTRHVRSSMLETFNHDYIRTALSKGMSVPRVVIKHALRNALIPLITVIGLLLPAIISGSMIIERVFSYPGMGLLFFNSIGGCTGNPSPQSETFCPPFGGAVPDFTNSLGLMVIMVVIVAIASMLIDILYVAADPRISLDKRKT